MKLNFSGGNVENAPVIVVENNKNLVDFSIPSLKV